MGHHVIRAGWAAMAAGAALAALGLAGAGTAAAATAASRAGIPIVYTKSLAGYFDNGVSRQFRFAGATVPVAACQPASIIPKKADNANAMIALISIVSPAEAGLAVGCGGGPGSITYSHNGTTGVINLAPSVGDVLRISVYHEVTARKYQYTVTDTTTGVTKQITIPADTTVADRFRYAELGSVINDAGIAARPNATTRLWVFKECDVTTNTGVHGTILGPWPTYRQWDTSDGTVSGTSVMYPTYPSDNGSHFGTWLVSSP
jgi:hypothetical protein